MPELPEVETVCRGLRAAMEFGAFERVELRRADLRFALPHRFAARLVGRRVVALTRRAKYILAHLDDGAVLILHLGMSGRFAVTKDGESRSPGRFHNAVGGAHEHVVFHMRDGTRIGYTDPRRFGLMDLAEAGALESHRLLASLGPEPLAADFTPSCLGAALAGKRTSLKAALLDQRVVAGLGNIYVCEALFRAKLSPFMEAARLAGRAKPAARLVGLVSSIKDILREAIEAGGSSLRDHAATDGSLGYFQHTFAVYDRQGEPCARLDCPGVIRREVQSGRSTFWCPHCQR